MVDDGCSFSDFSFSACMNFYLIFQNQNDGCDKKFNEMLLLMENKGQNMFQTWESYTENIYKNTVFLNGHGDYEKIR